MTIHLPQDLESSVRAEVASGRFASEDDLVAAAVRDYLRRKQEQASPEEPADDDVAADEHRPIWEVFQEISADVPDEVWDALPTDLSAQHDHYIYGTPKRTDV
jgi:Arc/MetJ-type ribon-helix-helix transcriptional regulator